MGRVLYSYIHKRKNNGGGRRPGITTEEIIGERGNGESLWVEPERTADREMVRKMMGKALEIGVTAVMENNVYRCGGEIRVQGDGGAIGVKMP